MVPGTPSDDEEWTNRLRQEIRSLVTKRELLEELARHYGSKRESIGRHPLTLLLLGTLLTGVLGGGLTKCWQSREWQNQQEYLRRQQQQAAMLGLVEDITLATAESFTAAEDVIYIFEWNWHSDASVTDTRARIAKWEESSSLWRTRSKMYRAVIRARFRDPDRAAKFDEILKKRRFLGNYVTNLLQKFDSADDKPELMNDPEVMGFKKEAKDIINETTGPDGLLRMLVAELVADIESVGNAQ
jgi:hypothetical protein